MKLTIKLNTDNEIEVSVNKFKLLVSEKSENFNIESINKFLVAIASSLPEDEKLEIEQIVSEDKKEDKTFKYVVHLFEEFKKNLETNE